MEESLTIEEVKAIYGIEKDETVIRLYSLQEEFKAKKGIEFSFIELLDFLQQYAMNRDEMQIVLLRAEFDEEELTLNDKLEKFFELVPTNDEILVTYDILQNRDQANIDNVRKELEERKNGKTGSNKVFTLRMKGER